MLFRSEIQRNLLPPVPERTRGYRWAARMVPAGQIGGDFYDFVPLGDARVLVIVGDVSGKGIPAALVHASLNYRLRAPSGDASGSTWETYLKANNLFDREARNHSSFLKDIAPLPGRGLMLGLRGSF